MTTGTWLWFYRRNQSFAQTYRCIHRKWYLSRLSISLAVSCCTDIISKQKKHTSRKLKCSYDITYVNMDNMKVSVLMIFNVFFIVLYIENLVVWLNVVWFVFEFLLPDPDLSTSCLHFVFVASKWIQYEHLSKSSYNIYQVYYKDYTLVLICFPDYSAG